MVEKWWQQAVVYQIYPKSYNDSNGDGIGDLKGITQRLDYIKELGVDVVWISPFYQSPQADNGYDISDYRAIEPMYGTMEDFDELLREAHARGIRIVLDLVVNHSSDQHPVFIESRSSRDSKYRDYYIWRDPVDGHAPTNWGGYFGGSTWTFDETTGQYYLHDFLAEQPDLNWDNPEMRAWVYDMMRWWCDKGIDGFRIDVISLISKPELKDGPVQPGQPYSFVGDIVSGGPHIHDYLKEMNREVLSHYDVMTVGEGAGGTIEEAVQYAGFDAGELNMLFQFEYIESTQVDCDENGKWTMRRPYLPDIKRVMNKWQTQMEGKAWNTLFWCNHDQCRIVSRWGNDSDEWREPSATMLATCLHMMKGTPYVYQGEELGMTNPGFADLSELRDVEELNAYDDLVKERQIYSHDEMMEIINRRGRDNSRTPMQWDDSANAGFTSGTPWIKVAGNYGKINAAEQLSRDDSVFHYYQQLIRLRHENRIIVYGTFEMLEPDHEQLFIYERHLDAETLLVVCNYSDQAVPMPEAVAALAAQAGGVMIHNYGEVSADQMLPYQAVVWRLA